METFFSEHPLLPIALEQIGKLSDKQYEVLLTAVNGPQGFDRSTERCSELASELDSDLTPREVFNLLGALLFLYGSLPPREISDESALKAFQEFSEFSGLGEIWDRNPNGFEYLRVAKLVRKNADLDRQRDNRWLQTAVADLAVDFDAFVDLRPRFSPDLKVEELVPVIMFRVAVESDHGPGKSHVFQLNMVGIEELQALLDRVQDQLESIRKDKVLGMRVASGEE